jgi:glucose-6-phosphate 1-dehydrogenase
MEPPVSFDADEIRNKKVDVLRAIRAIKPEEVHDVAVRGQYGPGKVRRKKVRGYRHEENVSPESITETFAALKLHVDNWRWHDVPFYLRTGKRMPRKVSEAWIQFRPVPHQSFPLASAENWRPNRLLIRIQPSEGILLSFQAKVPGLEVRLMPVNMEFCYQETFKTELPEAYETLLRDIIRGDATLFMRADQVEAAWSVVTPILSVWESESSMEFPNHAAGNWGPAIADEMLARDGYFWLPSSRPKGPSGFREFDPCVH